MGDNSRDIVTETSIIKDLARNIDNRKFPFQIPRAFIYGWECDYWTLDCKGMTREFEIKISRQDFLNDAKKHKHQQSTGANYFYYVCPKDLIKPEDIDPRYGLMHVSDNGYVSIVKKPRKLHDREFGDWKMLANKMYWKWYDLWKQKWIDKEITTGEYRQGFNIDLFKEEDLCAQ
jgi:hypothetical protein